MRLGMNGCRGCWVAGRVAERQQTFSTPASRGAGIGEQHVIGHVPAGAMIMKRAEQSLAFLLSGSLLLATAPTSFAAETARSAAQQVGLATPPTAAQPAQVAQQ